MHKQYKKDFSYSYSFGVFPTIELLTHRPQEVMKVYISPKGKQNEGIGDILALCRKHSIATEYAEGFVEKVSGNDNTYTMGLFRKFTESLESNANQVVLVNPSDPGNLGTIMRTMLGFNFTNLAIIKPAVDIFDPKTVRASMGALFSLKFQYFGSFAEYKSKFPRNFYPLMTNGKESIEKATLQSPYAFIFGNESSGLDSSFERIGTSLTIPQSNKIDSLNLSIAVGVTLFEAFKHSE